MRNKRRRQKRSLQRPGGTSFSRLALLAVFGRVIHDKRTARRRRSRALRLKAADTRGRQAQACAPTGQNKGGIVPTDAEGRKANIEWENGVKYRELERWMRLWVGFALTTALTLW